MARAPDRKWDTYFLGAGFSRSVGLPNTAELLREVHDLAARDGLVIGAHLGDAYKYFYPDEAKTFRPEVVDFFSVLRANEEVSRGMPGAFEHGSLLTDLRFVIARILCEKTRDLEIPDVGWANINEIIKPGSVIVTSNWDVFVEHYARAMKVPLRLGGPPGNSHVTLIKLHGSIDWTETSHRRDHRPDAEFAALQEMQNAVRSYTVTVPHQDVLRIRAVEHMNRCWQFIKARTTRPLMITMSFGKTAEMEPIHSMWEDAYYALGATKHLRIIGYSLPADDIEIRTLLRAGVARGPQSASVTVRNPETQVHTRVREQVLRTARSDYRAYIPS
jgi:hypothetical protein